MFSLLVSELKFAIITSLLCHLQEIRVVLQELSGEAGLEPSLNLLPQLSMQLQQKLLQLQTALSGNSHTHSNFQVCNVEDMLTKFLQGSLFH